MAVIRLFFFYNSHTIPNLCASAGVCLCLLVISLCAFLCVCQTEHRVNMCVYGCTCMCVFVMLVVANQD